MIDEKEVLKILKRYEGRMNPTAYFGLEADIANIPIVDIDAMVNEIADVYVGYRHAYEVKSEILDIVHEYTYKEAKDVSS